MNSKTTMPKDNSFFSKCTNCGFEWASRTQFLEDRMVTIIGYQANFDNLSMGFLLFNHSCEGTFSIRPDHFKSLYEGPIYKERITGSEECPGYCLKQEELLPCPAKCECSYVREIIQKIKNWPKVLDKDYGL